MSEIGMQSWFRVLIIYIYHCARTKILVHLDPRLENQEIVSKSAEENAVENQTLKRVQMSFWTHGFPNLDKVDASLETFICCSFLKIFVRLFPHSQAACVAKLEMSLRS